MEVLYSDEFAKQLRTIRDGSLRERVAKAIEKIMDDPCAGKPLRYELVGKRSLRVSPFRIIYEYDEASGRLFFHSFGHRKSVYGE